MDAELKEKLIDFVRKYKCLYEPKDKNYKNMQYKTLLWQNIGKQLDIDGEMAKKMWRSIRDGYMRYKKQLKQQTGSARKSIQYVWSEQMAFIDGSLELRATCSNVTETLTASEYSNDSDAAGLLSFCSSPQPSPPLLSTAGSSSMPYTPVSSSPLRTSQPLLATPPSQPRPGLIASKRKSVPSNIEEREDKVLEYLNNKKTRRTLDGVDHLFMSYADTFKKLPLVQQAHLKVELARLFANAELNALSTSHQHELPVVVLSPGCSILSQDSDSTENFVTCVEVPVDLSTNEVETCEDGPNNSERY